jgi:hypothetical protein
MLESEKVRKMLIQSNSSPHFVDNEIVFHLGFLKILSSGSS